MNTDSRKIIFIAISVTLFIMAIVYYSFYIGRGIAERYTPLVDATMEIKLEATTAHLWFEEVISGDQAIDIEAIWANLDQSEWYAQAMLDGGVNEEGTFLALKDPHLRQQIQETIKGIHHFRQIAQKRWATQSISGIGSDIEQQFDLAFVKFILSADNVESALQQAIAEDLQAFKFMQGLIITLTLILGIVIGGLSLRYETKRIKNINALKLSEKNLYQSKHQLTNVISGSKIGCWDWYYQTGEYLVNDEWLSILGLSRQDITNHIRHWDKFIHPNDEALIKEMVQKYIQSGKNYVAEFRMKHADSRWIWIEGSGSVIEYDEQNHQPLRLCGIHKDITERKLAELRDKSRTHVLGLLTSGDLLPVILEAIVFGVEQENPNMLCSILLLDEEGKHLTSGAAPSLPDFYSSAINGIEIGAEVGSCGTAAFTNKRVVVEDIQVHPYWSPYIELANKAGLRACWSEPIRSTKGKVLGTFAIYHHEVNRPTTDNIALIEQVASLASIAIEKIQANLALKASDEQMQLVLAGAELGFWDWNIVTGKVDRNERWATMLGYTFKEIALTTKQWADFVHQEDRERVSQSINDVLEGRSKAHSLEYRMLTKTGGYIWIHDQANVMQRHSNGKPLRMSGIYSDVTNRKLAEEKLKLAASVFSHAGESIIITDILGKIIDVNNAFTVTSGYNREEAIGKNPRILKSGRQSTEFYDDMWQALLKEGHWHGELWNRHKNGEVYAEIKTISAVRDEYGITSHYVSLGNDITPMKEHQSQLERIAHYDVLTNLPNRSLLADRLSQAMLQCSRHQQSLAVVFLDLDGFKAVNDTYGHDIGDKLLIELSARMKVALREGDNLARIGGDEFVAVLADLTTVEDCKPVLERLLLAASDPISIDGIVLNISASIGVTIYPQDSVDADLLMRHADQAMYVAKELGKNRYHLFDTTQDDAVKIQRESLEAIRSALDNHQFVLYYQPKVNMRTGNVTGVEALIRWQHPERGLLSPIDFLPVVENNPMSIEMGEWVIDTALTQIRTWQKMVINRPVSISVNIAAIQLQQPDFTQRLTKLLAAHPKVEPRYLELEILETSALDDVHHVSTIMNACKDLGVNFALDDFGTGYSSLTYLRRLPASLIKIDQSFVRDMLHDADDLAIVEGVIALAKSFKRDVIAEGVETIEHGTALLELGCELAQGYGIAKPMTASDIPMWISNWKPDVSWNI
jgi:diguanylate cyclase (GGDEF)-like protein/PAS domain S-box-containing protein